MCASVNLPSMSGPDDTVPGEARLVVDAGPDGGLRLHLAVVLVEERGAAPPVPS